mgnify:CR=1 FL=1
MTTEITETSAYTAALLASISDLADAACRRADPRLFDIDGLTGRRFAVATQWCATCPIAATCLSGAKTRRETGVWGGRALRDGADITDRLV